METKIPTHDEIRATFASVRDLVQRNHLCLDATIDDYPIGRRERGKCRLQVERAAGKGYRTVRTTTNKFGRWCAPKKSTYQQQRLRWSSTTGTTSTSMPGCGWATRLPSTAALTSASSTPTAGASSWPSAGGMTPRAVSPTLHDGHATRRVSASPAGGLQPENMTEEREQHVLEADSPEECDAWDVWVEELKTVRQLLLNVWKEAEVVTA